VKLHDFPRYPLTFGPSPVHLLDRLTEHLGGATVWAKREDCNSGLAFGGNKVRKLEYIVPDALAKGDVDTLLLTTRGRSTGTLQRTALIYGRDLRSRGSGASWSRSGRSTSGIRRGPPARSQW
jgi:1-aminocyclopropane-1-carboxylate deaminase